MGEIEYEWYNKGYDDGYSDAINNIEVGDILNQLESFTDEDVEKLLQAIYNLQAVRTAMENIRLQPFYSAYKLHKIYYRGGQKK